MGKFFIDSPWQIQNVTYQPISKERYFLECKNNGARIEITDMSMTNESYSASTIDATIINDTGSIGKVFNLAILHDMFEKLSYRKADYVSDLILYKRDKNGKETREMELFNCMIHSYCSEDSTISFTADHIIRDFNEGSSCSMADNIMKANITDAKLTLDSWKTLDYYEEFNHLFDDDDDGDDEIAISNVEEINNLALLYL